MLAGGGFCLQRVDGVGGQVLVTELAGLGWVMVSGMDMLGLDMLRLSQDLAVDSLNILRSAAR